MPSLGLNKLRFRRSAQAAVRLHDWLEDVSARPHAAAPEDSAYGTALSLSADDQSMLQLSAKRDVTAAKVCIGCLDNSNMSHTIRSCRFRTGFEG